jgi:bifunctional non-homologous end joining protein LigD
MTEWTRDGRLRHPSYHGLREDKPAEEVVREVARGSAPVARARRSPDLLARVRLTHPERVLYADQGITKLELARYLALAAPRMLPYVAQRPLMLLRCPGGNRQPCFWQKHAREYLPEGVRLIADERYHAAGAELYIEDESALVSLAQVGTLELHGWTSRLPALERPDVLVFDFDPDPGLDWAALVSAAGELRQRLEAAGLAAFAMLSGGKGVHVYAPLLPEAEWSVTKTFAQALAELMARDSPQRYVATAAKRARKGRIFVDYLRNGRGATAILPYSPRRHPGAPLAMPVDWSELAGLSAQSFRLREVLASGLSGRDPWRDFDAARVSLAQLLRPGRRAAKRATSGRRPPPRRAGRA